MKYGCPKLWILLNIILILPAPSLMKTSYKLTNVKCDDHDISFSHFDKCKLNVIRRGVISLDITVALYRTPVTNSSINFALYKRASGYRPFLYNYSQDLCAFFANRRKFPVLQVIFSVFMKHSNLNQTCPYTEDIVVKNLVLEEDMFRLLPLPSGEYLFKMKMFAYNDLKATVQVFFTCTE